MADVEFQQWCPVLRSVVIIDVRGEIRGEMVDGEVVRCFAYLSGCCKEIRLPSCIVGKKVLTRLGE